MSHKDGFGLREKQHDGTEFSVGAFIKLPPLSELPSTKEFPIPNEWMFTQNDDTCAKEATSNLVAYINGIRIDGLLTWVTARFNNGYGVNDWGVDLKSMVMAIVKMGMPRYEDSQFHSEDDRAVYADIVNWDLKSQQPKAIEFKAGSAVEIRPSMGMDMFDSIRATMWKLKSPCVIGIRWNWPSDMANLDEPQNEGFGHAVLITGWTKDRLVMLNSWGSQVGDKGYFYLSRKVVNRDADLFGAWTLIDETPEKVKWYIENGIYLNDSNWLMNIAKSLFVALKQALKLTQDARKETGVPPYPLKVVKVCEEIKNHEGWKIGSRSYRNNNPGNVKYVGQYKSTGPDAGGFAKFATYEDGWSYLQRMVYNHVTGKSPLYNRLAKDKFGLASSGDMTLYQYFNIYCEEDPTTPHDDDKVYAETVAQALGVSPYSLLKELLI